MSWEKIAKNNTGSFQGDNGLYLFTTVYPFVDGQLVTQDALSRTSPPNLSKPSVDYWKIVLYIPQKVLDAGIFFKQPVGMFLIAAFYLVLAFITWGIARIVHSRQLAQQEILELNVQLEKRMQEHAAGKENLSVTLSSIGDGVVVTDADGIVTRMNLVACKLTGWKLEEALGHHATDIFNLVDAITRQPIPVPVTATLSSGITQTLSNDSLLIARDGAERNVADSCSPIRRRDGTVIGAVLVFRDVTTEYTAKIALRDGATRIQTIFNAVVDGIVTLSESGIIETINPAVEGLFGYTDTNLHGCAFTVLVLDAYKEQFESYIKSRRNADPRLDKAYSREVEGVRKNGSVFPMQVSISEMQLNGQLKFTIIVRDITDAKLTEKSLTDAKERAEVANKTKDAFLATMSHEIRTPLTGILGMLEVLSMSELAEDQHSTLEAAWSSARNLLRIVSDILDWSKIQEGKLTLSSQSTSIRQLVKQVENTYSGVASSKNVMLTSRVDVHLSESHIVDPLRLSQVLNNFVSNAIKFTEKGSVGISVELLDRLDSGEKIRFSVKDTGIGIPKAVQQTIFSRYQQESADTARIYGGTGLGLSICLRLAELLDGHIELISEPGQGATFSLTIILPISAAPGEKIPAMTLIAEQRAISPLFNDNRQAPWILAVDDHPINRDLLARQIKLLGLRVDTAENGKTALAMWEHKEYSLIITDCHMPEMDGYTFSRAIRAEESISHIPRIPIIAWTANARIEEKQFCQDAGMDELLPKPTDLQQLKETLQHWLAIPEIHNDTVIPLVVADESSLESPINYAELAKVVPDSSVQKQVLQDYYSYICADLAKLRELLNENDYVNVERTAHRMKGSSRMIGAMKIGEAAALLESSIKNGYVAVACSNLDSLNQAITQLEIYLNDIIKLEKERGQE